MRCSVKSKKYVPLIHEALLLEYNPKYTHVQIPDGRENTMPIHHLLPSGQVSDPLAVDCFETSKAPASNFKHQHTK